jgi:hypothetical protein
VVTIYEEILDESVFLWAGAVFFGNSRGNNVWCRVAERGEVFRRIARAVYQRLGKRVSSDNLAVRF